MAKEAVRNAILSIIIKSIENCGNDFGSITIFSPVPISKPIIVLPRIKNELGKE